MSTTPAKAVPKPVNAAASRRRDLEPDRLTEQTRVAHVPNSHQADPTRVALQTSMERRW